MHAHTPWLDGKFRRRELFVLAHAHGRPWLELAQPRHGELAFAAPRGARPRRPIAELVGASISPWSPAPAMAYLARAAPGGSLPRRP
jgi:hypothetical protein